MSRQTRHVRHTIQIQSEKGEWYNYESGTLEEMSTRMDELREGHLARLTFRLVRIVTMTTIMETREDGEE